MKGKTIPGMSIDAQEFEQEKQEKLLPNPYIKQAEAIEEHLNKVNSMALGNCPSCGAALHHESGMVSCHCGYAGPS